MFISDQISEKVFLSALSSNFYYWFNSLRFHAWFGTMERKWCNSLSLEHRKWPDAEFLAEICNYFFLFVSLCNL